VDLYDGEGLTIDEKDLGDVWGAWLPVGSPPEGANGEEEPSPGLFLVVNRSGQDHRLRFPQGSRATQALVDTARFPAEPKIPEGSLLAHSLQLWVVEAESVAP